MVTIVSHISDYFEQFNSSLSDGIKSLPQSNEDPSMQTIPLSLFVFDFERFSDKVETLRDLRVFMIERWHNSFFYALAYLFLIYTGQIYMKNKPRFELRLWLAAWNTFLAVFSIFGAIRVLPELIYVIYRHGFKYSICNNSNAFGVVGFWTWAFCFSKLPELIDTVFIVLRKQPLIFLHWYHHASVLIYCWFSYQDYSSTGRWFCGLNYVVHGLMYSYYAFRAMKFRIPRSVSMLITLLQLTQMIVGCYINLQAWQYKKNGEICQVSEENLKYSLIMYATYFLLFAHFFLGAYITKSYARTKKQPQQQEQDKLIKKWDRFIDEWMVELEVKPSQIEGAGFGLFTRTAIVKGSCVCIYTGKVLRTIDAIRLKDKSYLMRLGPQVYIDPCDDETVLGRYINDARNRLLQNVVFDKRPDEQCAYVIAKRDIAAGEEIFADYGRWYWLTTKATRLEKTST